MKASSAMFDDKEAVECSKRACRNREEVKGGYHFAMVVQERQPTLGVARVLHALELFEIAGDRRLGDLEAELEQLAVNTWCSPAGILRLQPPNEQAMLCTDRPARWPRPPNPEQTEACTVPGDHCFWSDQNESIGPT